MILRDLAAYLLQDAKTTPVIAILGPRQSGKTTLAKATFKDHVYVTLEDLDIRTFAKEDPRAFLSRYENAFGVIFDEIQHVPELLSYIQTIVDANYRPGYYILTGSQNFLVAQSITQTLAGRISLHTLLPLSINELKNTNLIPSTPYRLILQGNYPIIYSRDEEPQKWYRDYIKTYVERDVRTLTAVGDLTTFRKFMQLCAGRIGQLLNLTSIGDDLGVSYNTVKSWISILEESYIIFLLQPHSKNFRKRLIKSPKLYFYDTGLACILLGIENEEQLITHFARGGLFESLIISEFYKEFYNSDKTPHLYFWRDKSDHEVDCIIEKGESLYPVEIKSGMTINSDFFDGLKYWNELANADPKDGYLVYGGTENQTRTNGNVIGWNDLPAVLQKIGITKG